MGTLFSTKQAGAIFLRPAIVENRIPQALLSFTSSESLITQRKTEMAGVAVLSALMPLLLDKLSTAALNKLSNFHGIDKELEGISTTLSLIQALLEDAEEKQHKDKAVRIWLASLKDLAYEIDELLDNYDAGLLQSKLENGNKKVIACLFPCPYWYKSTSRYKIASRIKDMRQRLEMTMRERNMLGLRVVEGTTSLVGFSERTQTTSLVDDTNVFGRDEDREKIVKILLMVDNNWGRSNVSVLPIVGMGGLGKTTLTQLVYNDSRIKEHFQLRLWICVSESFDVMKLTKETLESTSSIGGNSYAATTNMNKLQEGLSSELDGKLFLLVLDDVWNEDPEKWTRFCAALVSGKKGSKIVVTTRNENVGRIMCGLPPYRLGRLSDNDCWKLFKNCAFVDGNCRGHLELEKIGKEIVKKLKGLPLAAKALGSLLYSKTEEEEWENILRSEIWELPSDKSNILPALRLSYKQLPPHLKQCFTFCSVFHKDYVFEKKKLVQIWMALGYIQPRGRRRLEDIGGSYFDELLNRSFFQAHKSNYLMHDAIHDLAQSVSGGECLRLEDNVKQDDLNARHLSYSCRNSNFTSFEVFSEFCRLQTLVLLRGYRSRISPIPKDLFLRQKWLRVLDLNRRDITDIPYSIGNLKQLRYLSLSSSEIKTLPSSLGRLYNLQTLNLKYCESLREIPEGVTYLVNLRHLEASTDLISKIGRIGKLTSLQELKEFVVCNDSRFRISELKEMAELRGHLSIRNLKNVASKEEATEAQLNTKNHLSVLEFIWGDDSRDERRDYEVLEGLKPHAGVKELTVKEYSGTQFPSWLGNPMYAYLQTIHLSNCRRCKVLPCLGQLPFLKYLDIGTFGATRIGYEFSGDGEIKGFPSLRELVIADMPDLEEFLIEADERLFPCLTDLEILDCPKLRELPSIPPTLTRLRISEAGLSVLPLVWEDPNSVIPSSLSSVHINDCPNMRSLRPGFLGQQRLYALEKLTITDCEDLATLPEECFRSLTSLKSLHIYNCSCEDLATLPEECFRSLTSLKSLHIYNCSRLEVTERDGSILLPSSLEELQVSSCSNLIKSLLTKLSVLSCMSNLKISDCFGFNRFPDRELPPLLKSLAIMNCADLQFLPEELPEVLSLETLLINNCQQFVRLPEKGLPLMLKELYVKECPLLKERLERGGGDWEKIAHIPKVVIDDDWIQ